MIEGLKFQFSSAEMVKMFEENAAAHDENAAVFERRSELLQEDVERDEIGMSASNSGPRDYKSRAKHSREEAASERFLAAHVIPDEVYQLGIGEMHRFSR